MEVLASPPDRRLTGRRPTLSSLPFEAPEKYQLLRVLGSGGMGTVVLARDRELGRLVAIKFLTDPCPVFLERLRREARLTARLSHPAIVRVHEFDVRGGRAFLAMDYVDGGSLAGARLEPRALARHMRSVVAALEHAHALGVVHRDIKPENVLLDRDASSGRSGRAFLVDFGLAFDPEERRDGALAHPAGGTPLAMSPEQARGEAVGPASDVFSLGTTLYRQLTREWPFRGRTVADVLWAIQRDAPIPPRRIEPALPRRLEAIVLRALAKEPERRFGSAAELGRALDAFLEPSRWSRVRARMRARLGARIPHARGPRIHPEELS